MSPQAVTDPREGLYADLVRLGLMFGRLPHSYVVDTWCDVRHPREALDAVLGLSAVGSPDARALRANLESTPANVRDLLACAWWDSVTVRLDREGCQS
jgi:hypothetical protein